MDSINGISAGEKVKRVQETEQQLNSPGNVENINIDSGLKPMASDDETKYVVNDGYNEAKALKNEMEEQSRHMPSVFLFSKSQLLKKMAKAFTAKCEEMNTKMMAVNPKIGNVEASIEEKSKNVAANAKQAVGTIDAIASENKSLSAEISEKSNNDGTGEGKSSAYSLDFSDSEKSNKSVKSKDNKEIPKNEAKGVQDLVQKQEKNINKANEISNKNTQQTESVNSEIQSQGKIVTESEKIAIDAKEYATETREIGSDLLSKKSSGGIFGAIGAALNPAEGILKGVFGSHFGNSSSISAGNKAIATADITSQIADGLLNNAGSFQDASASAEISNNMSAKTVSDASKAVEKSDTTENSNTEKSKDTQEIKDADQQGKETTSETAEPPVDTLNRKKA